MTLEEIFYVSQSIASVAVVGSLLYLGLQVRAADRGQRSIMQQGRADRASKASLTVASAELARVWEQGLAGDPAMTREQVSQWILICRSAFLSGEDSLLQYRAGALDHEAFDSYRAGVRAFMGRPGFRAAWRLSAAQYGREFRQSALQAEQAGS